MDKYVISICYAVNDKAEMTDEASNEAHEINISVVNK